MNTAPANLLLQDIQYHVEETAWGTWRRFVYVDGTRFAEYKTHRVWLGLPLIHYTYGKCPETGKRIVASGVIAVGRLAKGVVAIGQASMGLIAIGQLAIGLVLGLGQAATGAVCLGQIALGMFLGVGQFAAGRIAIGQMGIGTYVLAQFGIGDHVVDSRGVDPMAQAFFRRLIGR